MSRWDEVCINDIASHLGDGLHGTPIYDNSGDYYFINGNNLCNGKIFYKQDTKRCNASEYKKYRKDLNDRTILVSINGTIGNIAIYNNEKCILGKSACYFNVIESVSKQFIKYVVSTPDFRTYLSERANGTTIMNVPLSAMRQYKFKLPPLSEQQAIAEVLSSLDDKIDLLHRNNKTLEEMAETLFRKFFVKNNETSSERLGDYIRIVSGYSYRSADLNESDIALVTLKNFDRNGGFRHDGFKEYTGKYKQEQVVVTGDLIVAHTDITQEADVLGNPAIVIGPDKYKTLIISTDIVKVVSTSYLSREYLYHLLKHSNFKSYSLGCSNGTTVLHLPKNTILAYEFDLPSLEHVGRFTEIVAPLMQKIFYNRSHVIQLESLRELILPKLMSGAVRIKNLTHELSVL